MSQDITTILAGWDFEPDELQVRIISGDDGRRKNPDADRSGSRSRWNWPDARTARSRMDSSRSWSSTSSRAKAAEPQARNLLSIDRACGNPDAEGLQYYHRYLSAFHLQKYDVVSRDTERNLRLFAFVVQHAAAQRDKMRVRPLSTLRAR